MLNRERELDQEVVGNRENGLLRKRKCGKAEICQTACCNMDNEVFHVFGVLGE